MISILQIPLPFVSLILASSSPFRKELLNKLGLDFDVVSPDIDESRKVNETPEQLVFRLAQEKAFEVAKTRSGFIIASDQVATLGDKILTKPHSHENAVKQLEKSSGNTVTFLTSLALLDTHTDTIDTVVEKSKILFKVLSAKQIEYYLQKEKPYNCAGSFKSEALGISLVECIEDNDPNTLIGLPLIQLIKMLENQGIDVLSQSTDLKD